MARYDCIGPLTRAGIDYADALSLRRIAMTLHRWFELECGYNNAYCSWAIERGGNSAGPPYMVHHHYMHGRGKDLITWRKIADRETGAKKRLAKIMAKYPNFSAYIQGDPRGASLYILRPGDVPEGCDPDSYYSRGLAVYKD